MEVWFTEQKSKLLEKEDKIKITLVLNYDVKYNKQHVIQFNLEY